jgi:hypothetical protein
MAEDDRSKYYVVLCNLFLGFSVDTSLTMVQMKLGMSL